MINTISLKIENYVQYLPTKKLYHIHSQIDPDITQTHARVNSERPSIYNYNTILYNKQRTSRRHSNLIKKYLTDRVIRNFVSDMTASTIYTTLEPIALSIDYISPLRQCMNNMDYHTLNRIEPT